MKKITNAMIVPGIKSPEEIASEIWEVPVDLISTTTRKREVVEARMVLMCFRSLKLKMSDGESAIKYGLSRNATMHARKTVENIFKTDRAFKQRLNDFKEKVDW